MTAPPRRMAFRGAPVRRDRTAKKRGNSLSRAMTSASRETPSTEARATVPAAAKPPRATSPAPKPIPMAPMASARGEPGPGQDLDAGPADGGDGHEEIDRGRNEDGHQRRPRDVPPRVLDLVGDDGHPGEARIGEEDRRRSGPHAAEAEGQEGAEMGAPEMEEGDRREEQEDGDLEHDQHVVEPARFFGPEEMDEDRGGDDGSPRRRRRAGRERRTVR